MTQIHRLPICIGIMAIGALTLLTGCHKGTDTADAGASDSTRPATAAVTAMPEQARAIAAQNAQGAEFDAKKRAAAMAKMPPKNP